LSQETELPIGTGSTGAPNELKRALGLWALVAFGVGDILGSGVYALVGKISGMVGTAAWISYVVAAVLAGLTGFTYAELTSRFPRAGGAAHFTHEIFKNRFLTFLVIFFVALSGLFSFATASHTFSTYALAFTEGVSPAVKTVIMPLLFVIVVGYITARGIMLSSITNIVCSVIEVSALAIIIVIGLSHFGSVDYTTFAAVPEGQNFGTTGLVMSGAAMAFFAFIGFEDMVNLAEEAKDPQRALPIAICLAIVITTVIYLLIVIAAVSVVPLDVLKNSKAALIDVVRLGAPNFPVQIYTIVPAFAVFNTGLLNLLMASRLFYGMARGPKGQLPHVLSYVHPRWQTPVIALIFAAFIVAAMVLSTTDVATLAGGTTTFLLIVFTILHGGLIKAKFQHEGDQPRFKIPMIIPFAGVALSLALLASRDLASYKVAGMLTAGAVVLFLVNRFLLGRTTVEAVE